MRFARDRWTLLLVVAAVALLAGVAVVRTQPIGRKLVLTPLMWKGKAAGCSLKAAWTAPDRLLENARLTAGFERVTSLVRRDGGLELWRVDGSDWWVPRGTPLPFLLAEQARGVYDGIDVQTGDVVMDCGANIGTYVRHVLDRGAGKVVAIEPVPQNVEALRRTFAIEIAEGRVIVYPKGVWDAETTLPMTVFDNSALDSFVMSDRWETSSAQTTIELPLTTLDRIVEELALDRVDVIKMDIEGAERRALRGATNVLRTRRPRLALATENLADDWQVLPAIARAIVPEYAERRGPCMLSAEPRIYLETTFLESPAANR